MTIEYRKKPGKNWFINFTNLSPELQSDLIATIHEWHESEDPKVRQSSELAAPVITDQLVVGDRATLTVEFRSIHEYHQDYFCRLVQYLHKHSESQVPQVLYDVN